MSIRPALRLMAVLLAAAALSRPAASQSREPLEPGCTRLRMRREQPARDRRRADEVRRDSLSAAVRDTLTSRISRALRDAGTAEPAGELVIEIRDASTGRARAFVSDGLPLTVVQAAVDEATPLLAGWPERDGYLHLTLNPAPPAAAPAVGEEYVECRPVPLNAAEIRDAFNRLVHTNAAFAGPVDVHLTYLVDRTGHVFYARVSRGTADPAAGEALLALARAFVLRPASVAGRPVSVWMEQPFQSGARR